MKADELIGKYVQLRDQIKAANKAHKEKLVPHTAALKEIELALGTAMRKMGTETFKSKAHGTAFFAKTDFVGVENWDAVLEYVKDSGNFEVFNKAVKKDVCKEYMADNNGDQIPGTGYGQKIEVQVRSPAR